MADARQQDLDDAPEPPRDEEEEPSTDAEDTPPAENQESAAEVGAENASGDLDDAADTEASASATAFKDSGSFFRERVARALAEQGYDFKQDGTWGQRDQRASDPEESAQEEADADSEEEKTEELSLAGNDEVGTDREDRPAGEGPEDSQPSTGATANERATEDAGAGAAEEAAEPGPAADAEEDEARESAVAGESAAAEEPVADEPFGSFAISDASAEAPVDAGRAGEDHGPGPDGASESAAGADSGRDDQEKPLGQEEVAEPAGTGGPEPGSDETVSFEAAASEHDDPAGAVTESLTIAGDETGSGTGESADVPGGPGPDFPTLEVPVSAGSDAEGDGRSPTGDAEPGPGDTGADTRSLPEPDSAGSAPATEGAGTYTAPPPGPAGAGAPAAATAGAMGSGAAPPPGSGRADAPAGSGMPVVVKKPGKGPEQPRTAKKSLWWRLGRGGLIVAGIFLVLAIAGFGVAYAVIPVPDAAKADATDQGSTFYYADGETEFAERGVNRDPVSFDDVPEPVQEAVISAEDRGFWTEPGVSVSGTLRAAWSTLTGQQLQGGSTITQQMVRNYYEGVSMEQTVSRKFKEIIISLKVDQSRSKEWVMEQYLNTIYFGRNAYGIQAAAQAYYHKDVAELEPSEAAFLAAAIQQPSRFGAADSSTTPAMEHRWRFVVNGMVKSGDLSEAEAEELEFPAPKEETPQTDLSGYKGYMLQQAMSELEDLGYTEDNINRGGYTIVTTFDKDLMEAAKEAVESTVDPDTLPEGVQTGMTAIDPATGEVVAFYGGKDYTQNQYDSAFRGSAQVGSSGKPVVLATALKNGYSLNSVIDGRGPQSISGTPIQNYNNAPGGPMNLIEATQKSNNVGYVNLAMEVGIEDVVQTAYDLGLPEGSIGENQVVPTLALGINDARPVDQASMYATFANGGEHVEPHVVKEIVNREGDEQRSEVATKQALTEGEAADVTYALQQVVSGGTGTEARLPDGRPAAGKTGTTDDSVATWFAGYVPQLSTAVSVYNSNNESFSVPGWGALSGGTLSATIWREFMTRAMEGKEVEEFPSPTYGGTTENWAPDVPTREPEEETEPEPPEAPIPEEPEPPEPELPTPEEPVDPGTPEEPPGEPVDPGEPEPPPDDPGEPETTG